MYTKLKFGLKIALIFYKVWKDLTNSQSVKLV